VNAGYFIIAKERSKQKHDKHPGILKRTSIPRKVFDKERKTLIYIRIKRNGCRASYKASVYIQTDTIHHPYNVILFLTLK